MTAHIANRASTSERTTDQTTPSRQHHGDFRTSQFLILLSLLVLLGMQRVNASSNIEEQLLTIRQRSRHTLQSGPRWVRKGSILYGEEKNARFGASVAISSEGDILAVGSPGCSVDPHHCVRVYEKRGNANKVRWRKLGSIRGYVEPKKKKGSFKPISGGAAISLSSKGDVLAVGYPDASKGDLKFTGVVVVYKRQGKRWIQVGNPIYGDAQKDQIGGTSDTRGGPNDKDFRRNRPYQWSWYEDRGRSTWGLNHGKLVQNLTGIDDFFYEMPLQASTSVALSPNGRVLAIGYTHSPPNPQDELDRGYVRVFRFDDDDWMEVGHPIDRGTAPADEDDSLMPEEFGFSVALSRNGHCLVAGAPMFGYGEGQVRVYRWNENSNTPAGTGTAAWEAMGQFLTESGPGDEKALGASVAVSSDCQCVAASRPEFNSGDVRPGVSVYDYVASEKRWEKRGGAPIAVRFWSVDSGLSVAVSKDCQRVAIGEPQRDPRATGIRGAFVGSVSVHEWNNGEGQWNLVGKKLVNPNTRDYHALFGYSIDLSYDGNTLVVGAPLSRYSDDASQPLDETVVGQAYVFELMEKRR